MKYVQLDIHRVYKKLYVRGRRTWKKAIKIHPTSPIRLWKFVAECQLRLTFQEDKSEVGAWMKDEIGLLGPAFVKFGQFLSTRQDLFGKEVSEQLSMLQDNVNPIPYETIAKHIEAELGRPISDVFSEVDPDYIGTASIGQVHRARLKQSGREVVLKVQKPKIAELVRDNLETLKNVNKFLIVLGSARAREFEQFIYQYEQFLSAELDYNKELNNMVLFYERLNGLPVRIPRVYKDLSSERVLVMEYVPSVKITDIDTMQVLGFDMKEICDTLVKLFLSQIIDKGVVHNDTQQGNIGVLRDGKTIVLYDFGNVVTFSKEFTESISMVVFAVVQKDVDDFVDMLIQLGILYVEDENEILEVKTFFMYFFKYLDGLDINALKKSLISSEIEGKFQENLNINPDFLSLFRVFSLLDGTIARLDSKYSYTDALRPYAQKIMTDSSFWDMRARKDIAKLGTYPRALNNADANILRVQNKVTNMSRDVQRMQAYIIGAIVMDHVFSGSYQGMIILPFCVYLYISQNKK